MPFPSRRTFLGALSGLVCTAGCLGTPGTGEPTPEPCSATDPPKPTDAATDPRVYPEKPSELTRDSVRSFVETYERTFRYNEMLAEHPEKIGRLNDVDISILEVTVSTDDGTFTISISGQVNTGIMADGSDGGTPTQTPLPMGHLPFEVSYAVSDRQVKRKGVVHECW